MCYSQKLARHMPLIGMVHTAHHGSYCIMHAQDGTPGINTKEGTASEASKHHATTMCPRALLLHVCKDLLTYVVQACVPHIGRAARVRARAIGKGYPHQALQVDLY